MRFYMALGILVGILCQEAKASEHEALKLEKVLTGQSFQASGRVIHLWGISGPSLSDPSGEAARLLLKALLGTGTLRCQAKEPAKTSQCWVDDLDVASMMVQAGMAQDQPKVSKSYYQLEEKLAKKAARGMWSSH